VFLNHENGIVRASCLQILAKAVEIARTSEGSKALPETEADVLQLALNFVSDSDWRVRLVSYSPGQLLSSHA